MEGTYLALSFEEQEAVMMAARKDVNGMITPIRVEKRTLSRPSICGSISNDEQITVTMLKQTLGNNLERMDIKGIYIGSCLRSMRSHLETVRFALNGKKTVSTNDEERLNVQMENLADDNTIKIYESVKRRDDIEVSNLVGEIASNIEKDCIIVNALERFRPKYRTIVPDDIEIRGIEPLPVTKAYATTTEEQRISGCLVIDFMSDMTSFTIFKDNALRGMAVVPFGFNDILHDAHKDDLTEKELKAVLTKHWEYPTAAASGNWTIGGKKVIFNDEFVLHVNSRIEEILKYGKDWAENILLFSNIKDNIIVTGLLSDRPGFVKLVGTMLDGTSYDGKLSLNLADDTFSGPEYWGLLSIINAADKNCIIERQVITPTPSASTDDTDKPDSGKGKNKRPNSLSGVLSLFSNTINGEETE